MGSVSVDDDEAILVHNRSGRVGTVFLGTRALYKRRAHKKGAADTTDRPMAPAGSPLTPRAERTADRAAPAGSVQPTQRCNDPTMPPLCQPTTRSTSGPKAQNNLIICICMIFVTAQTHRERPPHHLIKHTLFKKLKESNVSSYTAKPMFRQSGCIISTQRYE